MRILYRYADAEQFSFEIYAGMFIFSPGYRAVAGQSFDGVADQQRILDVAMWRYGYGARDGLCRYLHRSGYVWAWHCVSADYKSAMAAH